MGRSHWNRDAENNLFDYGEQQRKAAQQAAEQLSSVRIDRNRLRVALQDILAVAEVTKQDWIAGKCREALGMPAHNGQDNAHQKSQGE
mgnify:CR=1 FL=1